ncbi:APC family permease [Pseudolysinimonas sp.]
MTDSVTPRTTQSEDRRLRAGAMGTPGLTFAVVAMVGPMAALMGASPLVFMSSGASTPAIYLVSTLLVAVFAVGYLAMTRQMGSASGFISFISQGLGRRAGVAASYVTLITYATFVSGLYGIYAVFVQGAFVQFFGLDIHWAIWALILLAINSVLSYNRVEFSVRLMGVLLILAVVAILVLDIAVIARGGADGVLSFEGFAPTAVFGAGFGLAALFALGSFGGVEATAVFSEEVKDRRTTVPRAMYVSVLVLGIFYIGSTWLIANAVGNDSILDVSNTDPTGFIFTVAGDYVGPLWVQVLNALVVTSFFAVVLGFTNVASRYVFALGRAGILPQIVGRSHPKHQSPHIGSIVVGIAAFVIIGIFAVAGADPFAQLYTWLLAIGTVGVLVLMCASSFATVVYFRRAKDAPRSVWSTVIAPLTAGLGLAAAVILAITNFGLLAGGQGFVEWLWVLLLIAAVAGFIVGSLRRFRDLSFTGID